MIGNHWRFFGHAFGHTWEWRYVEPQSVDGSVVTRRVAPAIEFRCTCCGHVREGR